MPSPKQYEVTVYLNKDTYNRFLKLVELKDKTQSGLIRDLVVQAIAQSRDEYYQHELLKSRGKLNGI